MVAGLAARWLRTADGVRIRAACAAGQGKGTVLILPGRTEYIEKYLHAAADMQRRGYAVALVDWRGQGLADRLLSDPVPGHVARFTDYQLDLAACAELMRAEGLPEPWFILAHSMGGCIALRTLMDAKLPIRAAAFSGPMWGIRIRRLLRPLAWALTLSGRAAGFGSRYAPTTGPASYPATAPFEGNMLTGDQEMYDMMRRDLAAHPELLIGGPTMTWLLEAMAEVRRLRARPSPRQPCYTAYGSNERIIDCEAVQARMARWPNGRLEIYPGAEHEIVVETPERRQRFFDAAAALFASA